ncbi:SDR family NAD(P)-dependent oxidoreductase [Streptomyces sp. NPDC007205]|uniref:SDR family NAD(P)-dependent oxidoreductase n=1 Tax=Streptomyces sp. NPDC007205 TaxID=3154316 RepID=UPI0033D69329
MSTSTRPFTRQVAAAVDAADTPLAAPEGCVVLTTPDGAAAVADAAHACRGRLVVTDPAENAESLAAAAAKDGPVRHLRVVVDLRTSGWPAPPSESLRLLHDVAFLAASENYDTLRDGGSFVVLVLDRAVPGAAHPHGALFTGLVKSLAWELSGCQVYALLCDEDTWRTGLPHPRHEDSHAPVPPVLQAREGRLQTHTLSPMPSADPQGQNGITSRSAIVAVGGGQGITAAILRTIAEQHRPRIWVVGTTHLAHAASPYAPRTLADILRNEPGLPVLQARERLDRLRRAAATQDTITALRSACGADRVRYLTCDITDASAVEAAVDTIYAGTPDVGLLINAAGIKRAAALGNKTLATFRAVRDLKLLGYHHLKQAFAGRQPDRWCNFGSFVGAIGFPGETDYTACSDFLAAAACYEHSLRPGTHSELTIEWPLWGEVGMEATRQSRARHTQQQTLTPISTAEGIACFLQQMSWPWQDHPVITWLGDREVDLITQRWPHMVPTDGSTS